MQMTNAAFLIRSLCGAKIVGCLVLQDLVLDQSETTLEKSATKQLGIGAVPLGLEGSFYLVGS